jgi:hypothetical protein
LSPASETVFIVHRKSDFKEPDTKDHRLLTALKCPEEANP